MCLFWKSLGKVHMLITFLEVPSCPLFISAFLIKAYCTICWSNLTLLENHIKWLYYNDSDHTYAKLKYIEWTLKVNVVKSNWHHLKIIPRILLPYLQNVFGTLFLSFLVLNVCILRKTLPVKGQFGSKELGC